jgi:hypothetical protein
VTGQDRISIGCRASGAKRSRGATGTPDILHHKFLTEMTREDVSDDPPRDVSRPAGGEWNDDRNRSCRIFLGLGAAHSGYRQKHSCDEFLRQSPPPFVLFCNHMLVSQMRKVGLASSRENRAQT